jgi:hypothetical protein
MAKFPFGLDAYMLERHLDGNNEMQAAKPTTYGTFFFQVPGKGSNSE